MNIVYATNDLFSKQPTMVSIKTLLMNNQKADEINIFYIENGIKEENKNALKRLVKEYNRQLVFIKMPDFGDQIHGLLRTNVIVYSYCFLQDILPEDIDKALLIESDTIVTGDLSELYSIDLDGYYVAAADDLQSKWYKRKLGLADDMPYFNSGIMLLNLKKLRQDNMTDQIRHILADPHSKYFYEVQDELNIAFKGYVKVLAPKFGAATSLFVFDYQNMLRYRQPSTCCTESEFEEARTSPVIVHFTRSQIIQPRPWIEDCVHPFNRYYLDAKSQTEVKDEPLWTNKRSLISRFAYFVYSKISKKLVAVGLGFIHGFLYPLFLYRFIMKK